MERSTRRNALRRGLLFVGGLVGLGAAAGTTSLAARGSGLVLYARGLETYADGRRASGPPARGEQTTSHARLLDGPGGRPVGDLHVATVALRGPASGSADAGHGVAHLPPPRRDDHRQRDGGVRAWRVRHPRRHGPVCQRPRDLHPAAGRELVESDAEFVLRIER